jgi:hypothetical protein
MDAKVYNETTIWMLQQEVKQLEHDAQNAIEDFEARLHEIADITPVLQEDWSPRLDSIEIITMEQLPPLTESVRQIRA